MNDVGHILGRQTLYHDDKAALQDFFRSLPKPATVAMEATRSWYWLHDLMQEEGLQVKLAHPLKTKLIGEAKIKTDTIDAQVLAQLERTGFLPESYIPPPPVREHRELLRYRILLVATRTRLKNRVHDLIDKQGITHPFSDLFGTRGRAFLQSLVLPPLYQTELQRLMELIVYIDQQIKSAEKDIKALLKQDPRAKLLMTIPGVSHLTAYLLLSEIGDPHRFASAKKLCSYSGIIPSTHQTGGKTHHGSITKQGNKFIRWAMIEAAQKAIKKDPALQAMYEKLKRNKGSGIAKVAVAHKLLIAVYHILKKEEAYRLNSLSKIHLGKPVEPSDR
jgi:transposase